MFRRTNTASEAYLQRIPPFRTLDIFRGLAAIWVVMVHSCDRFLGGNDPSYFQQPLYAFAIRGQLGVVLFFVISGYCITAAAHGALYSGKPLRRYAFERGRRIFPPYWVALFVGLAVALLIRFAEVHHWIPKVNHPQELVTTPIYWIANLTLTQYEFNTQFANIVFWSLCYEVAYYAVVGVWLWAAQRVAKARGMAVGQMTLILGLAFTTAAALISLIVFDRAIFPFDVWHQFAIGGLFFYILESRPGTVAGYSPAFRRTLTGIAVVITALCAVYIAMRGTPFWSIALPSSKLYTLATLIFCVFLAAIRRFDTKIAESRWVRPLLWVGAASYSLYLIHPIVLPFLDITCRRMGLDGNRYWITFWIQVIVAVPCGRLFYVLIERHFISSRQTKRLVEEHAA